MQHCSTANKENTSLSLPSHSSFETIEADVAPFTLPFPTQVDAFRNPLAAREVLTSGSRSSSLEVTQRNNLNYSHNFHHGLISLNRNSGSLDTSPTSSFSVQHLVAPRKQGPLFSQLPLRQETTCIDHIRSVQVILPTTVAFVVTVMSVVTIVLLVLNTNTAVNDVANLLHDQVQAVVESRVLSHLDQVLSVNTASAKTVNARPLGLPPANNETPVNDTWLTQHLDSVVNGYALIDVHYAFLRTGRVTACLTVDANTNQYAEEYPEGLYFWKYPLGNISAIVVNRSHYDLFIPGYSGATRSYFSAVSRTVSYDYAWTNPYMVGPLLLFTNSVSMVDSNGVFQGVMGADSYITTLTQYFATLRPTPRTKVFVADTTGLLVISTTSDVLTASGDRISAVNSPDSTVSTAAHTMGNFATISTNTNRKNIRDGEKWLLSYRRMEILRSVLIVAVATPEVEFLGTVKSATNRTIGICVAIAAVGLFLVTILCIIISRALGRLERHLDRVAHLDIDDGELSSTNSEAGGGVTAIFSELQRTEASYLKLRTALGAFRRYVPQSVVQGVLNGDILPFTAMTPCQIAVTFHDIVGFTSMCELHEPTAVVQLVSELFEHMSKIIDRHNGTIDKYIGDAIMSFWEVGKPGTATAKEACEACVRVLLQTHLTTTSGPDGELIKFRAGAHFGEALIGNFGSSTRFSYTIVGDTVNSAARLEPLNKQLKTQIVISDELHRHVRSRDLLRHILYMGRIVLVGKVDVTEVYSVMETPMSKEATAVWKDAVASFEIGEYAAAKEILLNGPQKLADDAMAIELIANIDAYLWQAPPEHLMGIRQQQAK